MSKNIITVKNLHKSFKLPHEKHQTIKSTLINFGNRKYENLEVLKDINFEVKEGEFFGIVGRNGGGKSTILKLLAQIYKPTKGEVHVDGQLTPFIELGVGFNPELTGYDNVFLNGALLGLTHDQIAEKYNAIVEFAELEKFMDQKLKNYSSGMQVRLAFSIAIQAYTDVLLIDEVLAVGDANFQAKCYNFFRDLKKKNKTVVFVSHDMDAIQEFCDRAIIIEKGVISQEGRPIDIARKYKEINFRQEATELSKSTKIIDNNNVQIHGNGNAKIVSVYSLNNNKKQNSFLPNENIEVNIEFFANKDLEYPAIGMTLTDANGKLAFATNTIVLGAKTKNIKQGTTHTAKFTIENVFTDGKYLVSCAVSKKDRSEPYARVEDIHEISIGGRDFKHAYVQPKNSFDLS